MKKIYLLLAILFTFAYADTYKAIFDCSSSDAHYIKSRMWLIGKTKKMIEAKGDKVDFVLTLHGGCVLMVSKDYDFVVKNKDVATIKEAQILLKNLGSKQKVKVIACAMSLNHNNIDQEDVLPFIHISPNSFIDTIAYQNKGYALMTFK